MTPLHWIGDFVRNGLLQVPLPAVRALFLAILVVLLVWVLRLPNEETISPDNDGHWSKNLKVGASVALIAQIVIYSLL